MMYMAVFLGGLLLGFLIKDLGFRDSELKLSSNVSSVLVYLSKILTSMFPLTPGEFIKNGGTGVGFIGNQMLLVAVRDGVIVTLTDYPVKALLGSRYDELRVTANIPGETLIRDALRRIEALL